MHIAIIMDGNGRWARARGLPRLAGHRRGAKAVERTVEAAARLGVETLTLYAFSADNWRRPAMETAALMTLFRATLRREVRRCLQNGIRLTVLGRRDRLPLDLQQGIRRAEEETRGGTRMHLRVAIDYSSREAIVEAAALGGGREAIESRLGPAVDLLVRTSGEQRLSDFLLWESAYAELLFLDKLWPEFTGEDLADVLRRYAGRERRYGGVGVAGAPLGEGRGGP